MDKAESPAERLLGDEASKKKVRDGGYVQLRDRLRRRASVKYAQAATRVGRMHSQVAYSARRHDGELSGNYEKKTAETRRKQKPERSGSESSF